MAWVCVNGVGATGRVRLFVRQLTRRHCVLVSPGRLFDPVVFDSDTEEMESTLFRGIVVRGHFAPALAGGRPFLSPPHVSLMPIGQLGEEMAFQLWTPFLWASQHFPPLAGPGCWHLLSPPALSLREACLGMQRPCAPQTPFLSNFWILPSIFSLL